MNKYTRRSQKENENLILDIGIGVVWTLFFISLGLILAINLRPLYYANIHWFDLDKTSGLSINEIKANYNALIDYCSPLYHGVLKFPSLRTSVSGLSHFEEVKVIFNLFYITFLISTLFLIGVIVWKKKQNKYRYLKVSSITAIVLPIITLIGCSIDFETAFVIFHKIFFRNDDWLFDPYTDPIITLLPEMFFLQCALIIIFVVLVGSLILFLCYRHQKKKNYITPLLKPKMNYYY
ncbi:TIGR01906 family membrane protein [Lachnoclostridium phytofermentans]|uniref:TIGR01906 family membrane protein n=1 Tax=Lachnoclostridium phytofermentans TaxID=66219 RepID=UPI0006911E02|nr:TIGR01906 family membrane protein [Lachnoclostridium phytofermentans]